MSSVVLRAPRLGLEWPSPDDKGGRGRPASARRVRGATREAPPPAAVPMAAGEAEWDDGGYDDWGWDDSSYDVDVSVDTYHQDWDPNWDPGGSWDWGLDPPDYHWDPLRGDVYTEDWFGKDRIEYDRNYDWDEDDVLLDDHTASGFFDREGSGGGGG
jgi:hypothetical protein